VRILRLGRIDYDEAWRMQRQLADEVAAGALPTLLLLEHPHIYTFGRRGRAENLLVDEAELAHRGAIVRWVDRGGDVTYHGPGQLVGYPILRLEPALGQVDYLRRLEGALIHALATFDVPAYTRPGLTGVWADGPGGQPVKLVAIGVKIDARRLTWHGFALNVDPDMSYWEAVIACGLKAESPGSLAQIMAAPPSLSAAMDAVVDAFCAEFGFQPV
jgi:lipoate-protein ligase B